MGLKLPKLLETVFTSTPLLYLFSLVVLTLLDLGFGVRSVTQLAWNLVAAGVITGVLQLSRDYRKYRVISAVVVIAALAIWLVLLQAHLR